MKVKRFFLLCILAVTSLFISKNEVKINASEQSIKEETTTSFIVTSGRNSSLLLSKQNIVYGWGLWGENNDVSNSKKLLKPTDLSKNIKLEENEEFIEVFSGEQHSFILTSKSRVFAMGSGEKGQLGYSDYLFKSNPIDITSIFSLKTDEKIKHIACGSDFNVALTSNHRVLTFGNSNNGKLGIASDALIEVVYDITNNFIMQEDDYIIDVDCGASHTLALSNNGYLYGWGDNQFSQLSLDEPIIYTPTLIDILGATITKIECGRFTSYVISNQAQLYGFGSDSHGQLATHKPPLYNSIKAKPYLMNSSFTFESGEYIKDVISGYNFAIVKTNLNNYYSFGDNSSGQLANNGTLTTSIPQKIEYETLLESQDEIVSISCGENHCIAISKNKHILAWGSNLYGQLSSDENMVQINTKITDITHNFPPIVIISTNTSSTEFQQYNLDIDVFYLDNETIDSTYYFVSDLETLKDPIWTQFKETLVIKEYEGLVYVHIKVESKKETYYHVSKPFFLDHVAPSIKLTNKKNEEFLNPYTNSTIFAEALDNNNSVVVVYTLNGKQFITEQDTISFSKDGHYQVYALDEANNSSATIEFTIDTILPTITQIDNNLILNSSYSTSEGQITIKGSEALACYKLGYKGVDNNSYIALNDNENTFTINLKKGVNTLTLIDLAGNESLTYEIVYTPRFFQDTQLLLLVFGFIALVLVVVIIIVYSIRAKRKLVK